MSALPSGTFVFMAYMFFALESFVGVTVLAIACLNLAVIGLTRMLHSNLKCILITQSVAVVISVLDREAMLIEKLLFQQPFASPNIVTQYIMAFIAIFRRLLGHALIIERFMATVCSTSYEHLSNYFNSAWLSITFIIAFINCIGSDYSWEVSSPNLATITFSILLSLAEFLAITIIAYYNRKKYSNQIALASAQNYHIEQRYLVSDNVNTAKQLSPTFLCLFLSNLVIGILLAVMAFDIANEQHERSLAFSLYSCADQMLSGAIELTIMTHHPLLKKRFVTLLKWVFRFKRNQISDKSPPPPPNSVELENCSRRSGDCDEASVHFKNLQQQWNK